MEVLKADEISKIVACRGKDMRRGTMKKQTKGREDWLRCLRFEVPRKHEVGTAGRWGQGEVKLRGEEQTL